MRRHIEHEENSLDYFLNVEKNRYDIQPWMHDYFQFEKFAGKRVLEIGVGQGTDLVQFAKAGALCHAIDITDNHLSLAAQNFSIRRLNIEFKKCDAVAISYPDDYFDTVYSFGVIHHIPEAERIFRYFAYSNPAEHFMSPCIINTLRFTLLCYCVTA